MAIEIFNDIPEEIKQQTKFWFEVALSQPEIINAVSMLKEYRDSCSNEYEKSYVDCYFETRMRELIGE